MKILDLIFDMPLHPGNVSGFRAALVELAGREHDLLHNHYTDGESDHTHWRYPLVQYRVHKGRAALVALGRGVEVVKRQLLPFLPEALVFANQKHNLEGYCVRMRNYGWSLHDQPLKYGLRRWLGLNAKNYESWKMLDDRAQRKMLLGRALTGHLRAFADMAKVPFKDKIQAEVLDVHTVKRVKWHGNDFIGFDLSFASNLSLPLHVGLGRCVAFGFGEVLSPEDYQHFCTVQKRRQRFKKESLAKK